MRQASTGGDMMVSCPSCGAENLAQEAGQQVVCSSCFEIFDAPSTDTASAEPSTEEAVDDILLDDSSATEDAAEELDPFEDVGIEVEAAGQTGAYEVGSGDVESAGGSKAPSKVSPVLLKTMHQKNLGGYRRRGGQVPQSEDIFGGDGGAPTSRVEQRSRYSRSDLGDTSPQKDKRTAQRSGRRREGGSRPDSRSAGGARPSQEKIADEISPSRPEGGAPQAPVDDWLKSATEPAPEATAPVQSGPDASRPAPADPFADDAASTQVEAQDPFGAVGSTTEEEGDDNPFGGASPEAEESSSGDSFGGASPEAEESSSGDSFGGDDWNPFGGEDAPEAEDDPFGGSDLFGDEEVAAQTQSLLDESQDPLDDIEEEPMTLDVASIGLADDDAEQVSAGEALFELDLPEPDSPEAVPKPRRRRKGKAKPGGKRRKSRRKRAKQQAQRKRLLTLLLVVVVIGGGMSFTDLGPFGMNFFFPEETTNKPVRTKWLRKAKLAEMRGDKADGAADHIERITELKELWNKNQKDEEVTRDLARALLVFEERYPGVFTQQAKLVTKITKAVIKPDTLKEHRLGVRKLIIDKKYPEALKTLSTVTDATNYDVTVEDNYLHARIARLTNDNRKAEKLYLKVISEAPNYEAAAYDLARLYIDLKQFDKADDLLADLKKNEKHAGARLGLAMILVNKKNFGKTDTTQVQSYLAKALELSKKVKNTDMQFEIYRVRGELNRRKKDDTAEIQDLKLALEIRPGHEASAMALARLYKKQGQASDALKVLGGCKKKGCASANFVYYYVTSLYGAEQTTAARAELDAGLKEHPKFRELLMLKAQKEYEAKSLKNAIQLYRQVTEIHPVYELGHLKLAELLLEDGKRNEAVEVLETGIGKVLDKMSLMEKAARFHAKFGNNLKAKEYLERILKEDPGRSDLKLRFALLLKDLASYEDSFKYFEDLAKENALSAKDELSYAEVLHRLGRVDLALERLDCVGKSLDKERSMAAEIRCGALRTTKGDFDLAELHLKKALALEATDRAYFFLGMNNLARRRYEAAASNLKRAVELNRKSLGAKVGLARALRRIGGNDNLNKAMVYLTAVIEAYGRFRTPLEKMLRDPEAFLQRGELYLGKKRDERALSDFKAGLAVAPGNPDLIVAQAKALYHSGKMVASVKLLVDLIKRIPKHAGAHFYLGRMFVASRAPNSAVKHFLKCIQFAGLTFGHLHEAHSSLANLYKELKQKRKACHHMKQYLKTAPETAGNRLYVAEEIQQTCP